MDKSESARQPSSCYMNVVNHLRLVAYFSQWKADFWHKKYTSQQLVHSGSAEFTTPKKRKIATLSQKSDDRNLTQTASFTTTPSIKQKFPDISILATEINKMKVQDHATVSTTPDVNQHHQTFIGREETVEGSSRMKEQSIHQSDDKEWILLKERMKAVMHSSTKAVLKESNQNLLDDRNNKHVENKSKLFTSLQDTQHISSAENSANKTSSIKIQEAFSHSDKIKSLPAVSSDKTLLTNIPMVQSKLASWRSKYR